VKTKASKSAAKKPAKKKPAPDKGELTPVGKRNQKEEYSIRLAGLQLGLRLATDKSIREGTRLNEAKVRAVLEEVQQQSGSGGYDQGVICRILVEVVYILADLGLWDVVEYISGWAIEHNCWGGV
jgi:hypothetical protein